MTSPNQLSFLPDDYLERRRQRRTNMIFSVLFVVVIGSITAAFLLDEQRTRHLQAQFDLVDRQCAEEAKRIEQVQQMKENQRRMAHQAELTASLLEKVPRSNILAEITNAMPPALSLLDFTLEARLRDNAPAPARTAAFEKKDTKPADVLASARPRVYDVSMRLTGVAETDVQVALFISRLAASRLLKDVNLLISDEFVLDNQNLRKFQIEVALNPTAEVQSMDNDSRRTAVVPLDR